MLARKRKRNLMDFFNSLDGCLLCASVQRYTLIQDGHGFCVLCGQNKKDVDGVAPRCGRRINFFLNHFSTALCMRTSAGFRKSCWAVWYSSN